MTDDTRARAVRQVLADVTLSDDCLRAPGETALEKMGVDSAAMIELVFALEERFAIAINDDEVAPENFETIASLEALVGRKCL